MNQTIKLIVGEYREFDPRELFPDYEAANPEPMKGTFTVEKDEDGTSCTVNLVTEGVGK